MREGVTWEVEERRRKERDKKQAMTGFVPYTVEIQCTPIPGSFMGVLRQLEVRRLPVLYFGESIVNCGRGRMAWHDTVVVGHPTEQCSAVVWRGVVWCGVLKCATFPWWTSAARCMIMCPLSGR